MWAKCVWRLEPREYAPLIQRKRLTAAPIQDQYRGDEKRGEQDADCDLPLISQHAIPGATPVS